MKTKLLSLLLVLSTLGVYAQFYRPGEPVEFNNPMSVSVFHSKNQGDLLVYPNTIDTVQPGLVQFEFYRPDLTLDRQINHTMADSAFFMMGHDGLGLLELEGADTTELYLYYGSTRETAGDWLSELNVVGSDGLTRFSIPKSWDRTYTYFKGDEAKIVGATSIWDTAYYESGWGAQPFYTSHVYDVRSGRLEKSFPYGFQVTKSAIVGNDTLLFTSNSNFERYRGGYASASAVEAFRSYVFNMDYEIKTVLELPTSALDMGLDAINYATLFEPLCNEHEVYYGSTIQYYIFDTNGEVVGDSTRFVLSDASGNTLQTTEMLQWSPFASLWLPKQQKSVLIGYNQALSIPDLSVVGTYDDYIQTEDGNVFFAQYNEENKQVNVLNEDFTVYKTIQLPYEGGWSFVGMNQRSVCADDAIEVAFTLYDEAEWYCIMNEDNQVVLPKTEVSFLWFSMQSSFPMFARFTNEKYGRGIDSRGSSYQRFVPISFEFSETMQGDMHLYDQTWTKLRTTSVSTQYHDTLPEGIFHYQLVNHLTGVRQYDVDALTWEDAQPFVVTTDSALAQTWPIYALPLVEGIHTGNISGTLNDLREENTEDMSLFLLQSNLRSTQAQVFRVAEINGNAFVFDSVPNGTYQLWLDVPGIPQSNLGNVLIGSGQTNQTNVVIRIEDTEVSYTIPSSVQTERKIQSGIYPNPVTDWFEIPNANPESMRIMDLTGKQMPVVSNRTNQWNVSDLPSGVYLIEWKEGNVFKRERMLKQ